MSTKLASITSPPHRREFDTRLRKVQGLMKARGLDYYVASCQENVYYLSGFPYTPWERPFFLVIPQEGEPELVLPLMELSHAVEVSAYRKLRAYSEYPAPAGKSYVDAMAGLIPSSAKVGIESRSSLVFKDCIAGNVVIDDLIEEARLVKTEYEVGRIAHASSIAIFGTKTCLDLSEEGTRGSVFLSNATGATMSKVFSDIPGASSRVTGGRAWVWMGPLSAQPHSTPRASDAIEKHVPNVVISLVRADGYGAESERTFFVGKPEPWAAECFKVCMEARELAFSLIREGASCSQIDDKVLGYLEKEGHGGHILHRTGHGIGVSNHEGPWIARGSGHVLEENMVISVEPGIYISGKGGFRHSDTVLVTKHGYEVLTPFPDDLASLTL